MTHEDERFDKFRHAVHLIEMQTRILREAGSDGELVHTLSAILDHLQSMPRVDAIAILNGKKRVGGQYVRTPEVYAEASRLGLDEIEAVLANEKVTKSRLEAIAVGRFRVPRGSLRSIGNTAMLRDKIMTFVNNERAHETITALASGKKQQEP